MSFIDNNGSIVDPYKNFIHVSRYSRWLEDKNRRETWVETVDRYMDFMRSHLVKNYGYNENDIKFAQVKDAILHHKVMPSMRAMMTAGPALERDNIAAYNCAFLAVDSLRSFDEAMYILMNGTGVGFSVEQKYVAQLPVVAEELYPTNTTIVVEDSKLGWAKAYKELIGLLVTGQIPEWDMSKVRPAGARLKTFGGRASGPEPLNDLFKFTVEQFKIAKGRRLKSIEAHDLMCKIGEVVVVGGVRRSALISLSNLDDFEMAKAKSGQWWETEGQRALANNSAVYNMKPNTAQFLREWRNLYESKSGERGIYNMDSVRKHIDKFGRRDSSKVAGTNPCVTGDTVIATVDGPRTFADLAEVGEDVLVYSWHPDIKTPVIRWMRNPHRTRIDADILEVAFDSGLVVRCTPDHNFYSFRGEKVMAKNIKIGSSIRAFSASRDSSGHERIHGWDSNRNLANHQWSHRMLWEAHFGEIPEGMVIAHLDQDATNNSIDNLALMTDLAHRQYDMPSRQLAGMDGHSPNHKVLSVRPAGKEDVYNGCVDDSHSYIILDQNPIAGHMSGIVSANCGEILLRANEFCNLTEVVIDASDTMETLNEKVKLATILGTWQSTLSNFKYIRKSWQTNTEEERLLGVSLTGIFGNKLTGTLNKNLAENLTMLRETAVEVNANEADGLGIERSVAITTVKPSGTVSQLTGVSSGIHPWYSKYYLRSVRADNKDPLTMFLKDFGVPNEPDVMKPDMTTVFYFPIKAPDGATVTTDLSAIDHLEIWKVYRTYWTEHNPSVTINVSEDEWVSVGAWVYDNFDSIGGVSFLPLSEHSYRQAPYQEITKEEYNDAVAAMPKNIPWQSLPLYELEDTTTGSQELACSGSTGCEVVDLVSA